MREPFVVTLHDPYSGWRKEVAVEGFFEARVRAANHACLFGAAPRYDMLFTHRPRAFLGWDRITVHLVDRQWQWEREYSGQCLVALLAEIQWRAA